MNLESSLHPQPGRPEAHKPDQNLMFLALIVLRRWWAVAGPLGLVVGGVAAAAVFQLVKPLYEAKAVIRVSDSTPYIAFPNTGTHDELTKFVRTQIELIRSPLVLGPALGKADVARLPEIAKLDDPITELAPRIAMTSVGGSELVHISFTGPNPENAAKLVNAVTDAYFALRDQHEAERSARVIELLEKESVARAVEVGRFRENVRELAKQMTGEDPFAPARKPDQDTSLHPLAQLQNRLTTASVDHALLRAQITALEEWNTRQSVEASAAVVERAVEQDAEVQRLKARIAVGQGKLSQIEGAAARGRDDPVYARVQQELEQAEQALDKLRKDLQPRIKAELEAAERTRRHTDLVEMKTRQEGLALTERELGKRYEEQLASLKQVSGNTLELEFKRDELKRAQDVYDRIVSRIVALRTERGAPARVELLIPATAPRLPLDRFPYKKPGLAFLAGFLGPFLLLLLREWRTRRISDTEQLLQQTNLAVIAEIASLPSRVHTSRSSLGRSGRELRLFQESIDSLRTCLLLSERQRPVQVLVVTSATSREGKTSVAAQLAVSLAQASGERTLLIDADMRAPDLHGIFETELSPGLAQVLEHQVPLDEAVIPTPHSQLHFLPAGKLRTSPHRLLGNGALKALLDEAQATYRYVIVDTPPVLPAAESLVLAKAADATLFCVMRDVSRVAQVRTAFARLTAAGARLAGVVFNNVPVTRYAYTYGDYAYRHSK